MFDRPWQSKERDVPPTRRSYGLRGMLPPFGDPGLPLRGVQHRAAAAAGVAGVLVHVAEPGICQGPGAPNQI